MSLELTTREWAEKIAYFLMGSAQSLTGALEFWEQEGLDNDHEFCAVLDSVVFECAGCGWWCEQSEMTDDEENDWHCTDCAP